MKLAKFDYQVLSFLEDDYYGLWEVRDYVAGLMGTSSRKDSLEKCRLKLLEYFRMELIDVFRGAMNGNEFCLIARDDALKVLNIDSSWLRPKGITKVIAVSVSKKGEKVLERVL